MTFNYHVPPSMPFNNHVPLYAYSITMYPLCDIQLPCTPLYAYSITMYPLYVIQLPCTPLYAITITPNYYVPPLCHSITMYYAIQ